MDASYDYEAIYEQVFNIGAHSIIACQKVYKVKITKDLRKYIAPARGSLKWKQLYKARSAVKRINAYLKGYFLLDQIFHRTGKKAKLHVDLVQLTCNASKLDIDRLTPL